MEIDRTAMIEQVLKNWDLWYPQITGQFHADSPRLTFRIHTCLQDYILKGQPCSVLENTVKSNVNAHLFLGNQHKMAPRLYPTKTGACYISDHGYRFYLVEFIDGRQMEETTEDEYKIGQAARMLHDLQGYDVKSPAPQSKARFYTWFRDRSFVKEYDAILNEIPDFEKLDRCFVHTDIGPHNTVLRQDGKVMFIDLDDAGIGSRYLDIGWPFIMQFVHFDHGTGKMDYRFDLAQSFLRGYFGEREISREAYDLIFYGAMQMHISYMQSYGPDAVEDLWKILLFGMAQKEPLWELVRKTEREKEM
jgi:Ser/Thr protein kinase RdoA (MazF antagonist)